MIDTGFRDRPRGGGSRLGAMAPADDGLVESETHDFVADVRIKGVEFLSSSLLHASALTVRLAYETDTNGPPAIVVSADGMDFAGFEAGLSVDETIEALSVVSAEATRRVYRLQPVEDCPLFPSNVTTFRGRVLDYRLESSAWQLRVRFQEREWLEAFNEYCQDHDLHSCVVDLGMSTEGGVTDIPGLTPNQGRLLRTAYELGYFESPRAITQEDLAAEIDASSSAVSNRIRRATMDLIRSELL